MNFQNATGESFSYVPDTQADSARPCHLPCWINFPSEGVWHYHELNTSHDMRGVVYVGDPPHITVTSPAPGSIVSGTFTLSGDVSSDVSTIDHVLVGYPSAGQPATVTGTTWTVAVDTSQLPNGPLEFLANTTASGAPNGTSIVLDVENAPYVDLAVGMSTPNAPLGTVSGLHQVIPIPGPSQEQSVCVPSTHTCVGQQCFTGPSTGTLPVPHPSACTGAGIVIDQALSACTGSTYQGDVKPVIETLGGFFSPRSLVETTKHLLSLVGPAVTSRNPTLGAIVGPVVNSVSDAIPLPPATPQGGDGNVCVNAPRPPPGMPVNPNPPTITVRIQNHGNIATTPFHALLQYKSGTDWVDLTEWVEPPLAAKAEHEKTMSWPGQAQWVGNYQMRFIADSRNETPDLDRTNNAIESTAHWWESLTVGTTPVGP